MQSVCTAAHLMTCSQCAQQPILTTCSQCAQQPILMTCSQCAQQPILMTCSQCAQQPILMSCSQCAQLPILMTCSQCACACNCCSTFSTRTHLGSPHYVMHLSNARVPPPSSPTRPLFLSPPSPSLPPALPPFLHAHSSCLLPPPPSLLPSLLFLRYHTGRLYNSTAQYPWL